MVMVNSFKYTNNPWT